MLGTTKYFSVLLLCLLGCAKTSGLVTVPEKPKDKNTVTSVDTIVDPMSEWFNRVTQGNDPYEFVGSLHDSEGTLIGGGTLIRPNVVLTAGHCIDDDSISSVRFGGDEEIAVKRVVLHPHYSDTLGRIIDDIGIIFLECDSKYEPATVGCVAWMERYQGITTVGFSYGYKKYSKEGVFRYFGTVIEDHNTMKFIPRPISVWFGDSGGGVFTKFEGKEYVVGIISTFTVLVNYKGSEDITECSAVIIANHLTWIELEILSDEEMEQGY